ncbi:hypothetical protein PMPD1_1102 [Paramixta manurensis]|uniref:Uncharacterized protein n=1 Tax=Paramixta manurensis TaxID=2740817 RepID=A0A6M8U5Y9_9GAMM|nr:hypothetical protein PMPD1_1102 [Erwiniaceae bacterium PD-1]
MRELKKSELNNISGGKLDLSGLYDGSFMKDLNDFVNNTLGGIFENMFTGITNVVNDGLKKLKDTFDEVLGKKK